MTLSCYIDYTSEINLATNGNPNGEHLLRISN
jgi:hypothetical protein